MARLVGGCDFYLTAGTRPGAVQLPHGLVSVAGRFLASSQLRDTSSSSGSILYWTWDKIASGKLLKRWQAHYRAVSCLVFSDDESFLISGSDDGCVRVWSLFRVFDERENSVVKHPYHYSFQEHTLRVTDVVSGYGLCNSIVISSSEDHTCKVWSLSKGKLLRSVTFPCIINAVALDPAEHVFYAGGRDGKIYVAALAADCTSSSTYGTYIIGCLSDHSKAITCFVFSTDGVTLVSGSEDGTVRVWDTKSEQVIRILRHAKGPVNNVLIVRQPMNAFQKLAGDEISLRKRVRMSIPPSLDKYVDSTEDGLKTKPVSVLWTSDESLENTYLTSHVMMNQIKELQQQNSSAAVEMELERLREERKVSLQMLQQRKKVFDDLWKVHGCRPLLALLDCTTRSNNSVYSIAVLWDRSHSVSVASSSSSSKMYTRARFRVVKTQATPLEAAHQDVMCSRLDRFPISIDWEDHFLYAQVDSGEVGV
ncbi:hypothetical protein Taro_015427 [Colocasia esculenta]|uniref:Uncharacterized protein n=1 Tax=Colocasia esculenta TaxID=4460 RepID=A0A843UHP1_COLES|nr:hypothetical protein [Colocasia esculenta]